MNRVLLEEGRFALEQLCRGVAVESDQRTLLQAVAELWPRWTFRHVLSRGGWYRPGRVLDAQGAPLAEALAQDAGRWIERALEDSGEDMTLFCDSYLDRGLQVSRYEGQTHFFVAAYGRRAEQFIQLEIEALTEVIDRPLLDPASLEQGGLPSDLQDLLEPPQHEHLRIPLHSAHYRFRRVTDMAEFLARLRGQRPEAPPACRFVEEWGQSSSAAKTLCEHWVFALAEHLDRFKQPVLSAHPLALDTGESPKVPFVLPADALERADALHAFDKQRGYSAAWYFHMVARAGVPTDLALRIGEDLAQGLSYLPERDAALLVHWLDKPYSV